MQANGSESQRSLQLRYLVIYLFANSWLQFSFDLMPAYLLQVRKLSNNQYRANLWLKVAGRRLKLQHHARHFCDSDRRMAVDQL